MSSDEIGKVGTKGELYPPKKIREALGLYPNSKIRFYKTPKGQLIVERIFTAEELLRMPSISKISVEEIEATSEHMQKKGEE